MRKVIETITKEVGRLKIMAIKMALATEVAEIIIERMMMVRGLALKLLAAAAGVIINAKGKRAPSV